MRVKVIKGSFDSFNAALQQAVEDGFEVQHFNTVHVHPTSFYQDRYFHYSAVVVKR